VTPNPNARPADALRAIADIAHAGGFARLSESDALTAIRRLSLPYWNTTGTDTVMRRRVEIALAAHSGPAVDEATLAVLRRLREALPTVGINGWSKGVAALDTVLAALSHPAVQAEGKGEADDPRVWAALHAWDAAKRASGNRYDWMAAAIAAIPPAAQASDTGRGEVVDLAQQAEQASAWEAVVHTLDDVAPGWNMHEGVTRGVDLACAAIRILAAHTPASEDSANG